MGKSYYYHDISDKKLRLIFINDFDEIIQLADSNYWEPVVYDSTKPQMTSSTNYVVDDIVNCGVYTQHSFRCIQNCTSGSGNTDGQEPTYKFYRGFRAIQQEQAQWFVDTLVSTPQDYSIIIASHLLFSKNALPYEESKFCQNNVLYDSSPDAMETDFISNAINAFVNGSNYSENIVFSSRGAYMNTENDTIPGGGGTYAYTINKDFSTKNTGVKFIGFVGGHYHKDIVWKHNVRTSQYSITPTSSRPNAYKTQQVDLARSTDIKDVNYDALTIIGVDTINSKFCLARVGADISTDMYHRDIEKV